MGEEQEEETIDFSLNSYFSFFRLTAQQARYLLVRRRNVKAFSATPEGNRFCIALPIRVNQQGEVDHMSKDIAKYVKGLGYKTIESHMVYVHWTLTREIMVYEKT